MIKNLNRIANDTNKFLNSYIKRQSKTELIKSMKYGLLPGGKKIRSKILIDVGRIFNQRNQTDCIHNYIFGSAFRGNLDDIFFSFIEFENSKR